MTYDQALYEATIRASRNPHSAQTVYWDSHMAKFGVTHIPASEVDSKPGQLSCAVVAGLEHADNNWSYTDEVREGLLYDHFGRGCPQDTPVSNAAARRQKDLQQDML